jgi:hypothetical protein
VGPEHEGLGEHNSDVVSFHFDSEVHFNIANEIVGRTVVVKAA